MPSAIVTGDFDGDEKLDWVVANAGDNSLDLYLGNGDGTAQLPTVISLGGQSPVGLAAADLNADGKVDLVVAEADSQTIGILFGNGDGTFQPEIQISLPATPLAVAVADLNRDGHPDLLVGIAPPTENTRFAVLLNTGLGQFSSPIYAPNPTPGQVVEGWELSVADVNGDGIPDALVTGPDASGTTTQIYLGNGDGTFRAGEVVDTSNGALRDVPNAVLADVNGDGCPDVIDVDTVASVAIYPGDCKGNFDITANYQVYGVGDPGFGLAVADLNGDGYPDLIVGGVPEQVAGGYGTQTGNTVTVRLNDGTGHFGPAHVYRGAPGIFSLLVADLSGNRRPDIISADQNANSTTIYTNDGSGEFGEPAGGYDGFLEGTLTGPGNAPDSAVVVADINGDGKPDLALVEYAEGVATLRNITVLLNQGNGHFSAPIRSPGIDGITPLSVADFVFADFRKTGQPDFLAEVLDDSARTAPQLLFAENLGNGRFAAPMQIPFATQSPYGLGVIGVGDFNNDGNLDFAVATGTGPSSAPGQLTVYLGHGDGTFTQSFEVDFGSGSGSSPFPWGMFVGDANGDGKQDIFVWLYGDIYGPGTPGNRDLFEFLGNGDGTFKAPRDVLQYLGAMTMADLNHDGLLDVIDFESDSNSGLSGGGRPRVNVYLGRPDGSFGPSTTYAPYESSLDPFGGGNNVSLEANGILPASVADFDGDGNVDIAVFQLDSLGGGPAYVQFLIGNGDGTFTPTYDAFGLGIQATPDLTAPNLFGDGRAGFLQTPNFTASYQVLPPANGPSFQIEPVETPVVASKDALQISLDMASASDTTVSLSASEPGIQFPTSVIIPAGQISLQVPFTLDSSVPQSRWFSLTAQANGETQTAYDVPGAVTDSFTEVVVPSSTVPQGSLSGSWSAGVQSNYGAYATFQISCVGLPAGASCEFPSSPDPVEVPVGQSVGFQISADVNLPLGTYSFSVVAADAERTLTSPQTFNVIAASVQLSLKPGQINFGTTIVGNVSKTSNITITNASANSVTPFIVSGPFSSESRVGTFNQTTTCLSSLGPNSSCTISTTFASTEPGNIYGQIAVGGSTGPYSSGFLYIPVSATAADFTFRAAPGAPTTATVSSGQSATFDLQAIPDFFTGSISLTCSTNAPQSLCTVNPSALNVTTSNPVPLAITVSTTSVSVVAAPSQGTAPTASSGALRQTLVVVAIFTPLFGLTLGLQRQRAVSSRALLTVVFFTIVLNLASCGGSGAGGGKAGGGGIGGNGTPAGTYSIVVTGSAAGATRSFQLTIAVR